MAVTKKKSITSKRKSLNLARVAISFLFEHISEEAANDLVKDFQELLTLQANAGDEAEKKEIADVISELLIPSSMVIDIQDEFDFTTEDAVVREGLTIYRKNVGDSIRSSRQIAKFSQKDLSEMTGLSQSHISRIEKGNHLPTHATISKIAGALGVCPSLLDPGFESEDAS